MKKMGKFHTGYLIFERCIVNQTLIILDLILFFYNLVINKKGPCVQGPSKLLKE
jgi:hypothetical protein